MLEFSVYIGRSQNRQGMGYIDPTLGNSDVEVLKDIRVNFHGTSMAPIYHLMPLGPIFSIRTC